MDDRVKFEEEKKRNIRMMSQDDAFKKTTMDWFYESCRHKYSYNFTWMGMPIIQYPQDMIATQEIIWSIKPEVIIETGIARGGSLVFYASILELIGGMGEVIGIDVDIRSHNREAIENHAMFRRITMLEGSSTDNKILNEVSRLVAGKKSVMVILDSNHTHEHVLKELRLYGEFVTKGSYLIVFDTVIEKMPDDFFTDRPWKKGDSPATAVSEFLKENRRFVVEKFVEDKLMITVAPGGYLKCIDG